jgi:comEA protein
MLNEKVKSTWRRVFATGLAMALSMALAGGTVLAADQKIDINSASVEQLTSLPGVGQTLAQRIVDYREEQGDFGSTEELLNVKGIGEKSFAKLKDRLMVSEQAAAKAKEGKR